MTRPTGTPSLIALVIAMMMPLGACATSTPHPTSHASPVATSYDIVAQTASMAPVASSSVKTVTERDTTLNGRGFVPYLPVGIVLGSSIGEDAGFILGAEASLVWIEDNKAYWFGLNADVLRDFGYDATRTTAGLEAGYWIFGMEANVAYSMRDGENDLGVRLGLVSTIGVLGVFGRYTRLFDDNGTHYGELGALIKVPIPLF